MAVKKRITRKQLLKEPDTFMTFSGKAFSFIRANQKQIGYGMVGLATVVLAVAVFWYVSGLSEDKAYALLNHGLSHYGEMDTGSESGGANEAAHEQLHRLVSEYGSTTAGKLGWYLYGDVAYGAGRYEEAIQAYEAALDAFPNHRTLRPLIWNSLAYAYEGNQNVDGAIQCWEKVVDFAGEVAKGEAYFNLGRLYEQQTNVERAREAYSKVVEDFPDAVHADVARGKLASLGG